MTEPRRDWLVGPSLLFCPADRPERFGKASAAADLVILDLEDGVAGNKAAAREAIASSDLDAARTIVRVNPIGTADHAIDMRVVAGTAYRLLMIPKVETTAGLEALDGFGVIALCESPAGILNARDIAASSHVSALMWGGEDLTAAMGGTSSRRLDGQYTDVVRTARSLVLLAASEHGKPAIDSVYLSLSDHEGLAAECDDAARSGFAAKACLHPEQSAVVRRCFQPSDETVRWASQVIEAAADSPGAFSFNGRMVDEPLLRQARTILERVSAVPHY